MSAKGKISRLPFEVRQELNRRHRDGASDVACMAWLNSLPAVKAALKDSRFGGVEHRAEISGQNLSDYFRKDGPYDEWLKGEAEVEHIQKTSELAMRLAEKAGGVVSKPLLAILAGRISQALESASSDDQAELIKALSAVAGAEANVYRAQTDRDRLAMQVQTVSLDKEKFRYQVARDALRLFDDAKAREIAEGGGSHEDRIGKLLAYMEAKEKEE
ncbi:MAG: hypothetical protein WC657_09595 [Candidatus Paceibacterota bacterium]|jgi:hypothetical protein